MSFLTRAPKMAPDYVLYRDAVAAADAGPYTVQEHGINMGDYRFANIQVIPGGAGDNPTLRVLFWSEEAGQFIRANPDATVAGAGAGTPYEYTVECRGRIMFVELTGTLAVGTKVLVSGYSLDHTC
jgi:hypothetical protein